MYMFDNTNYIQHFNAYSFTYASNKCIMATLYASTAPRVYYNFLKII